MARSNKIKSIIRDVRAVSADFLLDVFYPKFCVGCGKYGDFVCVDCIKEIKSVKTSTCPECGKISQLGKFCPNCKNKLKTSLTGIIIAANFDAGPTREMIHHLKYTGLTEISELLGELIVQRLNIENILNDAVLVPVPLHIAKSASRGFNQSELIAQYVANRTKIPLKNVLVRIKKTESQVGLTGSERRSNLEGAFAVNKKSSISGKSILLIDDVTTTYSTLNECAKELKSAGAKKVFGLVVARG